MRATNETRKPTATPNGENGGAGALAGCVNDRGGETLFFACRYSGENADGHPDAVAAERNLYAARGWAKETVEHAARYGKIVTVRIFRAGLVECVSAMDAPETEGVRNDGRGDIHGMVRRLVHRRQGGVRNG